MGFWFKKRTTPVVGNSEGSDEQFFNDLRKREFSRLDRQRQVYLDYTGGNLYAQSLIDKHFAYLRDAVYGNPHSTNPTSQLSTRNVTEAREKVLRFFNAQDDYFCVFTANASGALQIVGECYPFCEGSQFLLTADNHNSVNGIREYCQSKGGHYNYCPLHYEDLTIDETSLDEMLRQHPESKHKLLAFPAQSNVSGVKHPLSWVAKAQSLGWDVLLDAAAYVPTSRLDLKQVQPDFVSVSFYKIFGYPTGIGCLLVKKSKFELLKKPWFAGGTVTAVSVNYGGHFLAADHERFENGTVNYLDIPAISRGLDFIENIGMERINRRVRHLTQTLIKRMLDLRHNNGQPLVRIFGPTNLDVKGGTIIFNVSDGDGNAFPFEEVEQRANSQLISLRTGCFCNPGIDEVNNCVSTEELAKYFSSRKTGNYYDMITYLGKMRGAIRISVGIPTTEEDIERFIQFLQGYKNKMAVLGAHRVAA
ncbi:MAG: aminotransferase class V-fold PLP-dependent enzyme [Saprospiraceae bacterium]|nr:aminotransferase class V-fold PLP-dependent enzyme [Saprospiraceae bacterium]